mmetsp:Transcript_54405/g.129965  ORF Transcript_54405/g.129965 Transcript_54405/m.129965 type:complete len:219 (-) Transcript_54405:331-987(-)
MMPTMRPLARSEDGAAAPSLRVSVAEGAFWVAPKSSSATSRRSLLSARSKLSASSRRSTTTMSPSMARFSARRPETSISSVPPHVTLPCRQVFMCIRSTPWKSFRSLRPFSTSLPLRCAGYTEPGTVVKSFLFCPRGVGTGVADASSSSSLSASFSPASGNLGRMRSTNSAARSAARPSWRAFCWQARSSVSSSTSGPTMWRRYQCATRRMARSLRSF